MPLVLVANKWQKVPTRSWIRFVKVEKGLDVADDYIADSVAAGDLVITNDIPLADAVIEKGCRVIRPRGEELDAHTIKQRLAVRDLMDDLRGAGVMTGGPPAYGPKEKQRFANAVDRWLAKNR